MNHTLFSPSPFLPLSFHSHQSLPHTQLTPTPSTHSRPFFHAFSLLITPNPLSTLPPKLSHSHSLSPGTYVFEDKGRPSSTMIVRVMPSTSTCTSYQVLPTNIDNLTRLGINKAPVSNLSPNWALIAAILALFVASLIGLLITVIIWKPTAWGLLPAEKIRPRCV